MSELAAEEVQTFAASVHEVWQYRLEFEKNLPAYNPNVVAIELAKTGNGPGGDHGAGAEYHLSLETERGPHPVVMTTTNVVEDEKVDATMVGLWEANETFVVTAGPDGEGSIATLTLWLDLPARFSAEQAAQILAGGRDSIRLELDGMRDQLDG